MNTKTISNLEYNDLIPSVLFLLACRYSRSVTLDYYTTPFHDRTLFSSLWGKDFIILILVNVVLMVLANMTAIKVMKYVESYLRQENALEKFCPTPQHTLFYTQLISVALIVTVPRFLLISSLEDRLRDMMLYGVPIMIGLYSFAYLASFLSEERVKKLWIYLSIIIVGALHAKLYNLPMELIITGITMTTLPVINYIIRNKDIILMFIMAQDPDGMDDWKDEEDGEVEEGEAIPL